MNKALSFLFLLSLSLAQAQIIPADRVITWAGNTGIPGGIPNRTTISATLSAGATQAQIQSALNAAPANSVVKLNAGTYSISHLSIPSNVTLRGSGPTTILNATGSQNSLVSFGTNDFNYEHQADAFTSITAGATKGSTSITVASTSGMGVGGLLLIDQINGGSEVSNVGNEDTSGFCGLRHGQQRNQSQVAEITAINGNVVTLQQPLFTDYTRSPEAVPFAAQVANAGIEDLKIFMNNTGVAENIAMFNAKYCWVKNIESDYADGDHIWTASCYRLEIRDSYFHDGFAHGPGQHDDTIIFQCGSTSNLVENNIMRRLHVGIMVKDGGGGHVIAYNFFNNQFDQNSINTVFSDLNYHGCHPGYVLWEGNVAGCFNADGVHGSTSRSTALRNVITGLTYCWPPFTGRSAENPSSPIKQVASARVVNLTGLGLSSYFNFVGNVLGCANMGSTPTFSPVFRVVFPTSRDWDHPGYVWSLGYTNEIPAPGGNTTPFTTLIDHGNWDVVNGTQTWMASIPDRTIPDSFYLPGKPVWFGNMAFPAINPASPPVISTATGRPTTPVIPSQYRYVNGVPPPAGGDTTPPTVSTSVVVAAGNQIQINFNEPVSIGTGGSGGWTLTMSGGAVTMSAGSASGSTVTYTTSRVINGGETGTVSYTQPGNGIEDSAGNDLATISSGTPLTVTNNSTQGRVATPAIALPSGPYFGTQNVTITDATSGSTIRYTTNNTAPTGASQAYTAPIPLSSGVTLRAIATKSGSIDSLEATPAVYEIGTWVTGQTWETFSVPQQSGTYQWSFRCSPSASPTDAVVGYPLAWPRDSTTCR